MKRVVFTMLAAAGLFSPMLAHAQSGAVPTFSKDVAPIFYRSCTACHRPGEVAPMSLLTFEAARPFARAIASRVSKGTMPPWHAAPAHRQFLNDRRLTAAEQDTILKWVSGGAPEGDPKELPAPPTYADGWSIGNPDAVFALQEDYPIPARGTIDYKYFEVPTNFTEDRWIQAFELKPGTPSVVHHIIVFARPPRREQPTNPGESGGRPKSRRQPPFTVAANMEEPEEVKAKAARQAIPNDRPAPKDQNSAFVGAFAPGQSVRTFQPGSAMRLVAGSTLVFQMHYTADGQATTDRSKIGFVFATTAPEHEVFTAALMNQNFTLPAGGTATRVDALMTVNQDMTLWSLMPHTHVRGRQWEVQAAYPDGRREVVLAVPNYDFNWQTDYIFKNAVRLPKGTVLTTSAWYDNSAGNKSNPDPTIDVHWGEQTWEEMQFTAFTFTLGPSPAVGAQ